MRTGWKSQETPSLAKIVDTWWSGAMVVQLNRDILASTGVAKYDAYANGETVGRGYPTLDGAMAAAEKRVKDITATLNWKRHAADSRSPVIENTAIEDHAQELAGRDSHIQALDWAVDNATARIASLERDKAELARALVASEQKWSVAKTTVEAQAGMLKDLEHAKAAADIECERLASVNGSLELKIKHLKTNIERQAGYIGTLEDSLSYEKKITAGHSNTVNLVRISELEEQIQTLKNNATIGHAECEQTKRGLAFKLDAKRVQLQEACDSRHHWRTMAEDARDKLAVVRAERDAAIRDIRKASTLFSSYGKEFDESRDAGNCESKAP